MQKKFGDLKAHYEQSRISQCLKPPNYKLNFKLPTASLAE